jgi:putative endonuclease
VYILANRSHTLYTGVTNDLELRVRQHKSKVNPTSFTAKYNITRLVYYEEFSDVGEAIESEKRIKGWTRAKKIALVETRNKYWRDLAAEWDYRDAYSSPKASESPSHVARGTRDPSLRSG